MAGTPISCLSGAAQHSVGVFALSVADVAFAAGAIADRDLRVDGADPGAPRIAVMRTHIWSEASEAMHSALDAAARAAGAAGARVQEMSVPPLLEEAWRAHPVIQDYEAYRAARDDIAAKMGL